MAQRLDRHVLRPSEITEKNGLWAVSPTAQKQDKENEEEEEVHNWDEEDAESSQDDAEPCNSKKEVNRICFKNRGVWLLFLNRRNRDKNGDTQLDRVWMKVEGLVKLDVLWKACCSTAKEDSRTTSQKDEGVISCFTHDYKDINDVNNAAVNIRKTVDIPVSIFYKTSRATKERRYRVTGCKWISLYRHDPDGWMFIREKVGSIQKWKRVTSKMMAQRLEHHVIRHSETKRRKENELWVQCPVPRKHEEEEEEYKEKIDSFEREDKEVVDNWDEEDKVVDNWDEEDEEVADNWDERDKVVDNWDEEDDDDGEVDKWDDEYANEMSSEEEESFINRNKVCTENTGKWLLFLDKHIRDKNGKTQFERVWEQVKELVEQGLLWKACCIKHDPKSTGQQDKGTISCFTSDYTNIKDVKNVAITIRKKVHLPFSIFYKTTKATRERRCRATGSKWISLYKHDLKGRLFVRKQDGSNHKWERVTSKTVVTCDDYDEPSSKPLNWLHRPSSKDAVSFKRAWVLRLPKHSSGCEEKVRFHEISVEIKKMVHQNKLKNVALDENIFQDFLLIVCCVRDSDSEKKVARAIRSLLHIEEPIVYKKYWHGFQGDKAWMNFVKEADMMYTQDGRMVSQSPVWKQVSQHKEDPPADQPSKVESSTIITAKEYRLPNEDRLGRWTVFFDKKVEDKEGNTELDRAWVKVKQLVHKGALLDAVTTTAAKNPYKLQPDEGAIFCYTRDYSDQNYVEEAADAIRKSVHPSRDMFFEPVKTVLLTEMKTWDFDIMATYKYTVNPKFIKLFCKVNDKWTFAPHKHSGLKGSKEKRAQSLKRKANT